MAGNIKNLVGKRMTKDVKFLNENIQISKLTVAEVLEIQAEAKDAQSQENPDDAMGLSLLKKVIRLSVKDASELTDEDFRSFPMDELTKLSQEIMKFSGMVAEQGK